MHGVTVGEKFVPAGVFKALGVTALIPRSFNIDAKPKLTENVEQEFFRDKPARGVGGQLKLVIINFIHYLDRLHIVRNYLAYLG